MMKHLLMAAVISLLLVMTAMPAMALEYSIDAAENGPFAPASTVEQVTVIGGGPADQDNIDRSKNAAKMPPHFGSPESYLPGTGTTVTPQTSGSSTANGTWMKASSAPVLPF